MSKVFYHKAICSWAKGYFGIEDKYFSISSELQEYSLRGIPYDNKTEITVYAINKEEAGSSFGEITVHVNNNGGKGKVTINLYFSDLQWIK